MRRRRRGGRRRRRSNRPPQPQGQEQQAVDAQQPAPDATENFEALPREETTSETELPAAPAPAQVQATTAVVEEHRTKAASATTGHGTIPCAIVSVSDTRNARTDVSGRTIRQHLTRDPYTIRTTTIVKDEPSDIRRTLLELLGDDELKVIILTGGTGIGPRDRTIEVLESFFEKELRGFGEIFRQLSYQEIGSAAILTRATAGVARRKFIACLPGSPQAVRLALDRILIPELPHILDQIRR